MWSEVEVKNAAQQLLDADHQSGERLLKGNTQSKIAASLCTLHVVCMAYYAVSFLVIAIAKPFDASMC